MVVVRAAPGAGGVSVIATPATGSPAGVLTTPATACGTTVRTVKSAAPSPAVVSTVRCAALVRAHPSGASIVTR